MTYARPPAVTTYPSQRNSGPPPVQNNYAPTPQTNAYRPPSSASNNYNQAPSFNPANGYNSGPAMPLNNQSQYPPTNASPPRPPQPSQTGYPPLNGPPPIHYQQDQRSRPPPPTPPQTYNPPAQPSFGSAGYGRPPPVETGQQYGQGGQGPPKDVGSLLAMLVSTEFPRRW